MEAWRISPVIIIYFSAGAIAFFVAHLIWRLRPAKGAAMFSAMMSAAGFWAITTSFETVVGSVETRLLLTKIEYLGIIGAVYFWFLFILDYTDYHQHFTKPVKFLLALVPGLVYAMILTADKHRFFYSDYSYSIVNGIGKFSRTHAIGFYIWSGYAYFLLVTGLVMGIIKMLALPRGYRRQIYVIAGSFFVVVGFNLLYLTGHNPIPPHDPTPLSFVLVGIIVVSGVYYDKFLDVMPIAHQAILQSAKTGIIVLDHQDRIVELNAAAKQILLLDDSHYAGKELVELVPDLDVLFSEVKRSSMGKTYTSEWDLAPLGKVFEVKVSSLKDALGNANGRLVMLWDITKLKASMQELDAYAYTVAHDLKNPLNHIMGFASLLLSEDYSEEEQEELLNNIVVGGGRMNKIIDELLQLAMLHKSEDYKMVDVDMEAVVQGALDRELPRDSGSCSLALPDKWPMCKGQPAWLEEVWSNYLSNAYKYGGEKPNIELGFTDVGKEWHFWVKDSGIGIEEKDMGKLFNKFSNLEKDHKINDSHGLGLSIVQRIVRKLGGKVWAESEYGKGSCFYFSLKK